MIVTPPRSLVPTSGWAVIRPERLYVSGLVDEHELRAGIYRFFELLYTVNPTPEHDEYTAKWICMPS